MNRRQIDAGQLMSWTPVGTSTNLFYNIESGHHSPGFICPMPATGGRKPWHLARVSLPDSCFFLSVLGWDSFFRSTTVCDTKSFPAARWSGNRFAFRSLNGNSGIRQGINAEKNRGHHPPLQPKCLLIFRQVANRVKYSAHYLPTLDIKSSSNLLTNHGSSTVGVCPARGIMTSFDPAIRE
jgi:hypothetical protein